MGRKIHRKVVTRPKPSIPTIFDCPRCEAQAIKIEIRENPSIATVICGSCKLSKTYTDLKSVYDKVDVFGKFVDDYYNELIADVPEEQEEVNEDSTEEAEN
jgi:transcription elongation factor Elf1